MKQQELSRASMVEEIRREVMGAASSSSAAAPPDRTFRDATTPKTRSKKENDLEIEDKMRKLHRRVYEHRLKPDGFLEPSSRAKYGTTASDIKIQNECRHHFKDFHWGGKGPHIWAMCVKCGLKSVCSYSKVDKLVCD